MPKELHVRIAESSKPTLDALTKKNGLYPLYDGRSAAYAVNELITSHPDFKAAQAQMASEQNPRPGARKR